MRVVHIVPSLFGEDGIVGGGERYALELARHMADETPTTLVSFGAEDKTQFAGKLRIELIGGPRYVRGQRQNPIQFSGLITRLREADVVHCHQQHIAASSFAALFCRMTGRKVFVSDLGGGGWDVSSYISTDRWYHGHLHISEYSRRIFGHAQQPWAHVVFGGVDLDMFSPPAEEQVRANVLYVGRIMPHKGINYLVEAMPEGVTLEIIGRPYDTKYYNDLKELSEDKDVIFRHTCTDTELVEAYRRALCIVLPSVYQNLYGTHTDVPELLGQTLLEGMSCGAPAICTDVASMPEVVKDQVTGFVVPPNDPGALREKILLLKNNPGEARRLGSAAVAQVRENFAWPAVVRCCLDIYSDGARAIRKTA